MYKLVGSEGEDLGSFTFCPTDSKILGRYKEVEKQFAKLSEIEKDDDADRIVMEVEQEIKKQFDYLFGFCMSDTFFKTVRPLAKLKTGEIFASHVLKTIGRIISGEMAAAENKLQSRIYKEELDNG